ncbi:putative cysteine-rich receptor-like protein kinase 31 [Glycine soja]
MKNIMRKKNQDSLLFSGKRLKQVLMASFKFVYLFILLTLTNNFVTTIAQFGRGDLNYDCSDNLTTPNSTFQLNVKTLLSYLSSNATANKQYYNTTVGSRNHSDSTVYGMFLCWGDLPPQLCSQCVANATKDILSDSYPNCYLTTDARIVHGDCMIRFSNRSFFSTVDLNSYSYSCSSSDASDKKNWMSVLSKTIDEVADEAANSTVGAKKYATKEARISGGFQSLYCEAQCRPDLSPQDCRKCLNASIADIQQFCEGLAMTFTTGSCSIRSDVYPFYRPSTAPVPTGEVSTNFSNTDSQHPAYLSHNCSSNETMITTDRAFLSNLKSLLSSLSSNFTTKTGFSKTTVDGKNPSDTVSGLFMCRGNLSTILCQQCVLNATQRISSECPSSKEAIIWYNHCLLRYSNNRSSLISTVDTTLAPTYQNFSIVNTSNPNQLQSFFTWNMANALPEVKSMIEDSTIKNYGTKEVKLNDQQTLYTLAQCTPDLSNDDCGSCLDKIFKYEIPWCCLASPEGKVLSPSCYIMFGLSPFYTDDDRVEAYRQPSPPPTTAELLKLIKILEILIEFGYMSPEYAMLGQFSEKSDIFSFGVMILEIITGKRSVNAYESHNVVEGLMGYVWRQWKDQEPLSILDSNIKERYSQMEVLRCIHIGLLCVQENLNDRPTITTIISYFNNHSLELPSPQEPAFLLHRRRMDPEIVIQQESSLSQAANGSALFSINEMSATLSTFVSNADLSY